MFDSALERLKTDLTFWEIGPYHGALPGPMKLRLKLDGEIIVSAAAERGFLHRGLEKALELHPWQASVAYSDHLDPEAAVFGELALCLAVEEMGGLAVPERAQAIRVILCELSRISSHLSNLVRVAQSVGGETLVHYVLRDRERILDLFELLTGSRFSVNFLRFGGVAFDVTEGFIERVLETCEALRHRLREYNDLFTFNEIFLKRTSGVGFLSQEEIIRCGVTGPNARGSGMTFDVRRAHPYSGYEKIDFDVPVGRNAGERGGDVHERFLVRLREVSQSLEILRYAAESIPAGDYSAMMIDREFVVPRGEAYSRVESSRGLLGCHVVSDGGRFPSRVQFRTPTPASVALIPALLAGIRVEDLPSVLASLDLKIAEADR